MSARQPLADIQFITDFAAFCRTKGDEAYDYEDSGNCALAQCLKAAGRIGDKAGIGNIWWTDLKGEMQVIPAGVSNAADTFPETFSALADRLEALLIDAPVVERGL